jgi:DNA-directed RNA polymerase specialized sigma24 family protein
MDDREIVSAMKAGALATLAGLAGAYDRYAAPLYSYCCWLLGDPDAAAEVVRDTFLLATSDLRAIRDYGLVGAQLYAVARGECQQRRAAAPTPRPASDPLPAGLRGLITEALAKLEDGEREAVELVFRHGLSHSDLAYVLGVPRRRAAALATHVREYLQDSLAVPIVAYTGVRTCPQLNELLPGWDGHLTQWMTQLVERHIGECLTCESLRYQAFHPAIVYALESPTHLPPDLRAQVIGMSVDSVEPEQAARGGTPAPAAGHARLGTLLAVAVIVIWVVAAISVTLLTILGSHSSHGARTVRTSGPSTVAAPREAGPAISIYPDLK